MLPLAQDGSQPVSPRYIRQLLSQHQQQLGQFQASRLRRAGSTDAAVQACEQAEQDHLITTINHLQSILASCATTETAMESAKPAPADHSSRRGKVTAPLAPEHLPPLSSLRQQGPPKHKHTRSRNGAASTGVMLSNQHGWKFSSYAEEEGDACEEQDVGMQPDAQAAQETGLDSTRKMCNCRKARCLKLYCVCFAAGMYCSGCCCIDCKNVPANKDTVLLERERILARSPTAFGAKIGEAAEGQLAYRKGCKCRKSRCLKKYCECFNAGVLCSPFCRCDDCLNKPSAGDDTPPPPDVPLAWTPPTFAGHMDPRAPPYGLPQHAKRAQHGWQPQYAPALSSSQQLQAAAAWQPPAPSPSFAENPQQDGAYSQPHHPSHDVAVHNGQYGAVPAAHGAHAAYQQQQQPGPVHVMPGLPGQFLQILPGPYAPPPDCFPASAPTTSAGHSHERYRRPSNSGQPSGANQLTTATDPTSSALAAQDGGELVRGLHGGMHLKVEEQERVVSPSDGMVMDPGAASLASTGQAMALMAAGNGMLVPPTPPPRNQPQVVSDPDSLPPDQRLAAANPDAWAGSKPAGSSCPSVVVAVNQNLSGSSAAARDQPADSEVMLRLVLSPGFARHMAHRAGLDEDAVRHAASLLRQLVQEAGREGASTAPEATKPAGLAAPPPAAQEGQQPQAAEARQAEDGKGPAVVGAWREAVRDVSTQHSPCRTTLPSTDHLGPDVRGSDQDWANRAPPQKTAGGSSPQRRPDVLGAPQDAIATRPPQLRHQDSSSPPARQNPTTTTTSPQDSRELGMGLSPLPGAPLNLVSPLNNGSTVLVSASPDWARHMHSAMDVSASPGLMSFLGDPSSRPWEQPGPEPTGTSMLPGNPNQPPRAGTEDTHMAAAYATSHDMTDAGAGGAPVHPRSTSQRMAAVPCSPSPRSPSHHAANNNGNAAAADAEAAMGMGCPPNPNPRDATPSWAPHDPQMSNHSQQAQHAAYEDVPADGRLHVPPSGRQGPGLSFLPASTRIQGRMLSAASRFHVPGPGGEVDSESVRPQERRGPLSGPGRQKAGVDVPRVLGSKLQGPIKLTQGSFRLQGMPLGSRSQLPVSPPHKYREGMSHRARQHPTSEHLPAAAQQPCSRSHLEPAPRTHHVSTQQQHGQEQEDGTRATVADDAGRTDGGNGQTDGVPPAEHSGPITGRKGPRCRGGEDPIVQAWGGKRRRTSLASPVRRASSCGDSAASNRQHAPLRRVSSADPTCLTAPCDQHSGARPPRGEARPSQGPARKGVEPGAQSRLSAEGRSCSARARKASIPASLTRAETACEEEVVQALFDLRQSA